MVGAGGKRRREDLRTMSLALHQVLDELTKKSSEQIKLSSSRDSWVQHLCWTGKDALSGEQLLTQVARHCQTSGGIYMQFALQGPPMLRRRSASVLGHLLRLSQASACVLLQVKHLTTSAS